MGWISPLQFFLDPIFQASTIGCMLMCLASSCMGVIVQLKRRSLVGEALSHATYPGIAISVLLFALFFSHMPLLFLPFLIGGATLSAYGGLWFLHQLEERFHIKSDAALCLVLSTFLGVGVLIASRMQFGYPLLYQQVQVFLYGQASTLLTSHVMLYGLLSVSVIIVTIALFHQIRASHFDPVYARVLGLSVDTTTWILQCLLVLAVVIGIRSVGVVLMSGMLIAPAVAARQMTNRLSTIFIFSGFFGLLSGFLGNYLSVNLSLYLLRMYQIKVTFPTGPLILIIAAALALLMMLFAPKRGAVPRTLRIQAFKYKCVRENILKAVYKSEALSFEELRSRLHVLSPILLVTLMNLKTEGLLQRKQRKYQLTDQGQLKAGRIVRLHRLWELYLHMYLGFAAKDVHKNAEEMEHILTPELEEALTRSLDDPKKDPHDQIIPEWGGKV